MTFEKAVRFVEPLLASEVAKKADFFAPEARWFDSDAGVLSEVKPIVGVRLHCLRRRR